MKVSLRVEMWVVALVVWKAGISADKMGKWLVRVTAASMVNEKAEMKGFAKVASLVS